MQLHRRGRRKPKTGVTENLWLRDARFSLTKFSPALHPMIPVKTQGRKSELAIEAQWG
jgi:hypothetical protein